MCAVANYNSSPVLEFFGKHAPYPSLPTLHVVGMWSCGVYVTGDASGGGVTLGIRPVPQNPALPYLPNLECWYTIKAILLRAETTMAMRIIASHDWPTVDNPYSEYPVAAASLIAGGDGNVYFDARGWEDWVFRSRAMGGLNQIRAIFQTNVNGELYLIECFGLLLKPEQQLISEGLWDC